MRSPDAQSGWPRCRRRRCLECFAAWRQCKQLAGRLALASSQAGVDGKVLPFPSSSGLQPSREEEKSERLTVEEASALSKLPRRWFYRHKELSFIERLSRKCLRIHKARFLRWLETKRV
jgi:hypothetical protein